MTRTVLICLALGLCGTAGARAPGNGVSKMTPTQAQAYRKARARQILQQRQAARRKQAFRNPQSERENRVQNANRAAAQPGQRRRFFSDMQVSFAAGLNAGYAKAYPEKEGATRNAMAFSMGLEKKLNDTFYFTPEIAYVQRGVQTTLLNVASVNVVGNVRLDYLELPLLLKAKLLLSSPRWKIFFQGGPSIAVTLNREVEILGLVQVDLSNRFSQVDFTAVLGTGVEYQVSPDFAVVGTLRHSIGLVDIDTTDTSFYTRGIQLLLGVQFRL